MNAEQQMTVCKGADALVTVLNSPPPSSSITSITPTGCWSVVSIFLFFVVLPQLLAILTYNLLWTISPSQLYETQHDSIHHRDEEARLLGGGAGKTCHEPNDEIQTYLETRRFEQTDVKDKKKEGSCPICLMGFEPTTFISHGPCGHTFCNECIMKWLMEGEEVAHKGDCPCCREPIIFVRQNNNRTSMHQQQTTSSEQASSTIVEIPHRTKASELLTELLQSIEDAMAFMVAFNPDFWIH